MSDPTLSDIDFRIKLAWFWTTLKSDPWNKMSLRSISIKRILKLEWFKLIMILYNNGHIIWPIPNNGYIIMKSFWNQLLNVQFIVPKFKCHVTKIFYWIRLWHMFCHTLTHFVSYSFMQCHSRWQWQRFMTKMWHPFNMKLI